MSGGIEGMRTGRAALARVLAAALGAAAGLLLGGILFWGRSTVLYGAMLFSTNPYLPRFLDRAYLVVFGCAWLVAWFLMYWYLGDGVKYNNLRARVMRVAGILLVLLFIATAPGFYFSQGRPNVPMLGLVTVGLAAGVLLIRGSRRALAAPVRAGP